MDSFNSNIFYLALNALINENCCNKETQMIIIQALEEEFANLKTSAQQEKARLEAQIKEAEIENKGKELKMLELEELNTTLRQTIFNLEKSSQQEKMLLEAQIREKDMKMVEHKIKELELMQEHVKTISNLEQISQTQLEVKTQLKIQNLEAQSENAMKAMEITELETDLRCILDGLEDTDKELKEATDINKCLELDLETTQKRVNELSAKVSHLALESEYAQRENRNLRRSVKNCEESASSVKRAMDLAHETATKMIEELRASLQCREQEHLKAISYLKERSLQEKTQLQKDAEMESDRQKSKIKELEELLTNVESREREHLKQISDLETNSQNEKTRLMAQIQEMENAMINARVPLESSVDDIIDVKVEEKEIKHQNHGKNTCEKWKKGLLIGGGCLAAAVALWKYGPDVSGVASALNQPRLTGNLL